jgi:hypothetical protein
MRCPECHGRRAWVESFFGHGVYVRCGFCHGRGRVTFWRWLEHRAEAVSFWFYNRKRRVN